MWGLSEKSIEEIRGILASIPAIEEAVIYGSRSRGDYKAASDIDLALTGRDLTFRDVALLDDRLSASYQPYFFDTSILAEITNPDLLENIRRNGQVFYRR